MATQRTRTKGGSKSDAIREVIKHHPQATAKEIRAALNTRGVKASDALINKIKYGRNRNGSGKKSSRRRKNGSQTSKAEAIRGAWNKLGTSARPRDVIALLATRGIAVSSAQVSVLRKRSGGRRRSAAPGAGSSVSYVHLLAARDLAVRLGGIEHAQQALASLATLREG